MIDPISLFTTVGFPVAVAVYVLVRLDSKMTELAQGINQLTIAIKELEVRVRSRYGGRAMRPERARDIGRLVIRAQAGDDEAKLLLVEYFTQLVRRLSFSAEGQFDEDLSQELYAELIKAIERSSPERPTAKALISWSNQPLQSW